MYKGGFVRNAITTIGSIRSLLVMTLMIMVGGTLCYLAGYGAIRYAGTPDDVWQTWTWWEYYISAPLGMIILAFIWWFGYNATTSRRRTHPWLMFFVCGVAIGWYAVFIVFEIVKWTRCNDQNGPVPREPNCINRDYPAKTIADTAFILTFVGGVTQLVGVIVCMYIVDQVRCLVLAGGQVMGPNDDYSAGGQGQGNYSNLYGDGDVEDDLGLGSRINTQIGTQMSRTSHVAPGALVIKP